MIVMKVDLIHAGKRLPTPSLVAVQPAGSRRVTGYLAVVNKRTELQRVPKFPTSDSVCRRPRTHNNATYTILKIIYHPRLPTRFHRLPSWIYVSISQVKKTSNFTSMHRKAFDVKVNKTWLNM